MSRVQPECRRCHKKCSNQISPNFKGKPLCGACITSKNKMVFSQQKGLTNAIFTYDDQKVTEAIVNNMEKRRTPLYDTNKGEHPMCFCARIGKSWSFNYFLERTDPVNDKKVMEMAIESALN